MAEPMEPTRLIDLLEAYLLGEKPSLTGNEIADELDIPFETSQRLWRSLGFSAVGGDVPAFTHADLEALRLTQKLSNLGMVDEDNEAALVRAMGRSFARLAEWQMGLLARTIDLRTTGLGELAAVMDEMVPTVEALQNYVWRRHTLSAASRLLLAAVRDGDEHDDEGEDEEGDDVVDPRDPESGRVVDEGVVMGVGFADIVDYTRQSRQATRTEIARMIDGFEARSLEILTSHGGRIIKTIGDEILFVADAPDELARIGLELSEERHRDEGFPELRVGMAWGPTLARLGDVLGPVVNVASRLTSTARPGRVLVDRSLADELQDSQHFKLRRLRRTSVRGYRRLEPWSLRRPADEDPDVSEDGVLPGPISSLLHQQVQDLRRVVDQMEHRGEGPAGGEHAD
ncbi:MAG: adenylate/guanylate cyclase domain-containing protein [Marmoricola sp.]